VPLEASRAWCKPSTRAGRSKCRGDAVRRVPDGLDAIAGLREAAAQLAGGASPPRLASAIEFVLEGLHLANRLNKTGGDDGRVRYARR
jgi:hypothetical protein